MKKAERKRTPLLANLGDFNRPLRVRPVRYLAREWWAVDGEDTWPGMVMDLRRLGFEAVAMGEEVLVREGSPMTEPKLEGPAAPEGLKPFPLITPTIRIHRELSEYMPPPDYGNVTYLDEYDEDDEDFEGEDEYEAEDLDTDYR